MKKLTAESIQEVAKRLVVEGLYLREDQYEGKKNETFVELGANSLDLIGLIMSFEEELGYEFLDEELEKITTPKEAETYLIENLVIKES